MLNIQDRQQLISELNYWEQKSHENLTEDERKEVELNMWEINLILRIEDKKRQRV